VNPQHQLVTPTYFDARLLFYALLLSDPRDFIDHTRKHLPNLCTRPHDTSGKLNLHCSQGTTLALPSHRKTIQNA
jgi:hypothetical protein